MTDAPAAILATFSDLRLVKSRKTAQLVFELPMERLKEALDALGMPDPQGSSWCGIALVPKSLGDGPTRENGLPGPLPAEDIVPAQASPAKPKKRWHEMPASQRAALLVQDTEFWMYLRTCGFAEPTTEMAADTSLKSYCGISTKAALDLPGPSTSNDSFAELEGNFRAWRQARQLGAA